MKLNAPQNVNYAAAIVQVRHLVDLPNCDNVVGLPALGHSSIVSKDAHIGELGVYFVAETQLSEEYARINNLHRHGDRNDDPNVTGYLEDNRRVKSIKFRGNRSDALFMPLSSLAYTGIDISQLKEGDTFDVLDGHEICQKYVSRKQVGRHTLGVGQGRRRREPRVDEALFPRHFDTTNYYRAAHLMADDPRVVVTQKLHGTSLRVAHTLVKRKLRWWERAAKKLGVKVTEQEWAIVYGSRSVVKDAENPDESSYYGSDLYARIGARLFKAALPKGFIVYGEIVGWVPETNKPIQKGYTYQIPEGVARFYAYRVTTINPDGYAVDLSWQATKEFCASLGVDTVPELTHVAWPTEGHVATFLDKKLANEFPEALPTDGKTVDEGVCLRSEHITPVILKAKSPEFLRFETKMLDQDVDDLEAAA